MQWFSFQNISSSYIFVILTSSSRWLKHSLNQVSDTLFCLRDSTFFNFPFVFVCVFSLPTASLSLSRVVAFSLSSLFFSNYYLLNPISDKQRWKPIFVKLESKEFTCAIRPHVKPMHFKCLLIFAWAGTKICVHESGRNTEHVFS